ncbi:hypothetical protein pb186bvf_010224 [Paramecium bursaria]
MKKYFIILIILSLSIGQTCEECKEILMEDLKTQVDSPFFRCIQDQGDEDELSVKELAACFVRYGVLPQKIGNMIVCAAKQCWKKTNQLAHN